MTTLVFRRTGLFCFLLSMFFYSGFIVASPGKEHGERWHAQAVLAAKICLLSLLSYERLFKARVRRVTRFCYGGAKGHQVARIASLIDRHITEKNVTRSALEKPPLPDYFRDFSLLQEVTKAACSNRCGEITIVHTTDDIAEFSVTSCSSEKSRK